MATALSICNSALVKLGSEVITSLSDNNKRAKLCNAQYEIIKKKVIYSHPWNFAIKRKELSATGEAVFEFSSTFKLPTDYLRSLYFETDNLEYQREGDKIVCNSDTVKLKYIANVDESLFTDAFAEVLAFALAREICYSLVQSSAYKEQLGKDLEEAIREARSFDAQEGTPPELTDDSYLNVRY